MNQIRLEIIKAIVTDVRSKRVIDELVAEVERLQQEVENLKKHIRQLEGYDNVNQSH